MSAALLMRAILVATALSAVPAIANAQAPQAKRAQSTTHKPPKASVHNARVEPREAQAGKKAKKRASSSRLPFPEHPNGRARW